MKELPQQVDVALRLVSYYADKTERETNHAANETYNKALKFLDAFIHGPMTYGEASTALAQIREIIDRVENRCMAVDGPVTPTTEEMTEDELRRIYVLAGGKIGDDNDGDDR